MTRDDFFEGLTDSMKSQVGQPSLLSDEDWVKEYRAQTIKERQETHQQNIYNQSQNTALRKEYANKVFWLTACALLAIGLLLAIDGAVHIYDKTFLSDSIIEGLLVFAGIHVVGMFTIILSYLFGKSGKRKPS